ncbi:MAG: hypothetical protein WC998_09055 [Candidatus Paceibacterota bacterium]
MNLRANIPEFTLRLNRKDCKRKSIFIADDGKLELEGALEIAKDLAQKMGMGNKELLIASDATYSMHEGGWQVVIKSRI